MNYDAKRGSTPFLANRGSTQPPPRYLLSSDHESSKREKRRHQNRAKNRGLFQSKSAARHEKEKQWFPPGANDEDEVAEFFCFFSPSRPVTGTKGSPLFLIPSITIDAVSGPISSYSFQGKTSPWRWSTAQAPRSSTGSDRNLATKETNKQPWQALNPRFKSIGWGKTEPDCKKSKKDTQKDVCMAALHLPCLSGRWVWEEHRCPRIWVSTHHIRGEESFLKERSRSHNRSAEAD